MNGEPPSLPVPGQVLLGKYVLKRLLGRGGVGVVYEAEHLRLRQRVAVKFLAPEMAEHADMVERFEREARAMALMSSPYVTRVIDVDTTEARVPFLVMEFLQGHDLQAELKARGALTIPEAAHWVREACAGMAVAHAAGIVHRDLKPANLFIVDEANARTLKIMDFGISKITGEDLDVTMTTTSLGTPAYMSPEQVKSAKHIDGRADVWSLGVILYRALSGRLPFRGSGTTGMAVSIVNDEPEPIEAIMPDLPPGLIAVVRRALEKNPDARFPSVGALSDALAAYEHGGALGTQAPPPSVGVAQPDGGSLAIHVQTRTVVRTAPRKGPLVAGGVAVVAVAALAAFFAVRAASHGASSGSEPKGIEGSPDSTEAPAKKSHKSKPPEAAPSAEPAPKPSEPTEAPPISPPPPEPAAPRATAASGSAPAASAPPATSASAALPKPLVGVPAASGPTALPKADPKPPGTAPTGAAPLPVLL
jgi:serine/threonine-protein kinase